MAQESYEEMAAAIQAYAVEHPPAEPDDSLYYDLELREEELSLALNELKALAPYGPGVEKPVLMVRDYQLLPKGYHSHRLMGRSNTSNSLVRSRTPWASTSPKPIRSWATRNAWIYWGQWVKTDFRAAQHYNFNLRRSGRLGGIPDPWPKRV